MSAMDMPLLPAVATTFEVIAAIVSAVLYLGVGIAAMLRAPRDVCARVFMAIALASAAPYSVTILLWARGAGATFPLPVMATVGLSLMIGSLTLFHFTQVFPWRRPWITAHWRWLMAGYLLTPVALAVPLWIVGPFFQELSGLSSAGSGGLGAVSIGLPESLVLLLLVVPALFILGLVLPFVALLSIYKSWLTAKAAGVKSARVATLWVLISQMGGGVLTILIIPLLHLVAPTGPWATIAAVLLFAFGLLMPIAFAAGIWKYGVLSLDPDAPPARL
jgi:hypothetical protein